MQYGDIQNLFYQLTKTNSTDVPAATLNLYLQPAEDYIVGLIIKNDATWQFDDSNYSDLPVATTAIVSGQQQYNLAVTHLAIDRIEIAYTASDWRVLSQVDQQQFKGGNAQSLNTLSTSGKPTQYDISGTTLFLYPVPDYSLSAALKLYYTRGPLKFDYTTGKFTDGTGSTSSQPGFASIFHEGIPYKGALNFAIANSLNNVNLIADVLTRIENNITSFYGLRDRDIPRRMMAAQDSNR